MSDTKKQRPLWRFYLKEFAIPEADPGAPGVWRFSRSEADARILAIAGLTEEFPFPDGPVPDRLWPVLANGFADIGDPWVRRAVGLVAAGLLVGIDGPPEERAALEAELSGLRQNAPAETPQVPAVPTWGGAEGVIEFDASSWFERRYPTAYDRSEYPDGQGFGKAIDIAGRLEAMRWSIIVAPQASFVTTDRPVSVLNRDQDSASLEAPGSFVLFALSPTRLLVMDDRFEEPASRYFSLTTEGPALYNYLQMVQPCNFVFSHRHPDQVNFELLSALGYLYSGRM